MEIVPVEKVIVPVKRVETFPGSKTVKLCPEILADEQRVCTSFADELMSYLESEDQVSADQKRTIITSYFKDIMSPLIECSNFNQNVKINICAAFSFIKIIMLIFDDLRIRLQAESSDVRIQSI